MVWIGFIPSPVLVLDSKSVGASTSPLSQRFIRAVQILANQMEFLYSSGVACQHKLDILLRHGNCLNDANTNMKPETKEVNFPVDTHDLELK